MTQSACAILLIEDNPMDVDLTRRAFARHKLVNPLQVARDGEEALAYLQSQAGQHFDPASVRVALREIRNMSRDL